MHHPVLPHPLHVFSWLFLLTSGYFILGPQPPQLVWAAFLSPSPRAEPAEARTAQGRRCHVPGAEGSAGNSLHMERAALGCPQLSGWPMGSLPSSRPPQTLAAPAPCLAAFGSVASCLPAGPACRVPWMPPCSCQLRGSQRAQCHLPCAGAGGAGEAGTAHPGARGAGGSRTSDPAPAAAPGTAADIQRHRLACTRQAGMHEVYICTVCSRELGDFCLFSQIGRKPHI